MVPLVHPHYLIQTMNELYDRFTDLILTLGRHCVWLLVEMTFFERYL